MPRTSKAYALPVTSLLVTCLIAAMEGCAQRTSTEEPTVVGAALGASAGACDDADSDEVTIAHAEIPAVVTQAAINAVPGFVLEEAVRIGEGDSAVYELEGHA